MFEKPSGSFPPERDDVASDAEPAAAGPERRMGTDSSKDETSGQAGPAPRSGAVVAELLGQVPPAASTFDVVDAPLPQDHPQPSAVRLDDDGASWAGVLGQPPGPQLLAELLDAHPASLGDLDLVASLAAWERVASWVAARHHEALGALLARAGRFGGLPQTAAIVATEVGYTQRAAQDKLAFANTLGTFPAVAQALETGSVDVAKARAICDEALKAPPASAHQVAALGLALAARKTPPQLRRALRAAVIGLDPQAAAQRAAHERAERRVEFHPLPDAMALITAYLPATDAMAVKTALDALARTTGTEDPRTFDQRRADYLAAIFHAICDTGQAPLAHRPHREAISGHHTDTHASHHADAHTDTDTDTETHTGTPTGTDAGAGTSHDLSAAHCCDAEAAGTAAGADCARAEGTDAAPICLPRSGHILWRRLATNQRQRPHLQVTIADTTLLGLDDHPGDLTGYGPIPADVARLLASDATWRALYTDRPGTVTAVGEHTYRPGAVLTRQVTARDRTCTFTGCTRPAVQCDIDHREAYTSTRPANQQTHLDNLHALCRLHHNLKTHHGWTTQHHPQTGTTTWTSPLGTQHERDPEPPLPPWETWLESLDRHESRSPCPCNPHDQRNETPCDERPSNEAPNVEKSRTEGPHAERRSTEKRSTEKRSTESRSATHEPSRELGTQDEPPEPEPPPPF